MYIFRVYWYSKFQSKQKCELWKRKLHNSTNKDVNIQEAQREIWG